MLRLVSLSAELERHSRRELARAHRQWQRLSAARLSLRCECTLRAACRLCVGRGKSFCAGRCSWCAAESTSHQDDELENDMQASKQLCHPDRSVAAKCGCARTRTRRTLS